MKLLPALFLVPLLLAPTALAQEKAAPAGDAANAEARALANRIAALNREGRRDDAERLVAASAGRAVEIDDARADLAWSVRYRACDGRLVLTVSRAAARAQAPLVVSVPAGSYGISSAGSQDLGLLRAPVIVLRAGETSTSASAPVACASFDRTGPGNGEDYELARFERGSPIDRLMVALCSGATAPEQAGQLAVWVVRNGLTRSQLAGEPFAMTFENHLFVSEANAPDAADVIRRAGLDVGKLRFFDGLRLQRKEPATPPPAPRRAPAPRPEPGANLS